MAPRFAVGIDLGTTNTVVAWAPRDGLAEATIFAIPQLVAPGQVEDRALLPSLLYAPLEAEKLDDPFHDDRADPRVHWALGEIARRRGAEVPGRTVASSKSWLTHGGIDRTAPVLPWGAPDDAPRLSPVDAATRLLLHVARAWDSVHADAPLGEQDVVLTVPASFDEVARELTLEASRRAGLSPKLLEEPQAAFYDWMTRAGPGGLARLVSGRADRGGQGRVLIVDVGGGTTDLSLVEVAGVDRITRVAVGPHILLGGDNMDLALAHAMEPRLAGSGTPDGDRLGAAQFAQLVAACRGAKERLLGDAPPDEAPVTVLGSGAKLVGGGRTGRLTRAEVERIVLDGFFPILDAGARPERARSALVAFGLPYERDVAISRHVAGFLARHGADGAAGAGDAAPGAGRWPDAVLLNGGVFRAPRVAERVVELLGRWRGAAMLRLPDADPDLAVARGAVAYARARLGRGVRIRGGSGRGYFVGVAAGTAGEVRRAVCVVPRGAEEGETHVARGRTFALSVGRPVRFDLLASDQVDAQAGDVVDVDDERFARMPPLAASIDAAAGAERVLRVLVEGELTAVGTVDLACVEADASPPKRFRLAFQLREDAAPAGASAGSSAPPAPRIDPALGLLDRAFGKPRPDARARDVKDLLRDLERVLGDRGHWTGATSRALFDALFASARARRRSADHERAFWLLAGWCIRPGYGDPLDPQRVTALGPLFDDKLAFPAEARGWQQFWIAWRRAAAGLNEPAQTAIRDFADAHLAPAQARTTKPKKPALSLDDALDMASSLERVPSARRAELGGWVIERTWTDRDPRLWSAIGRLGARVPTYASVHHVVPPTVAERWLDHLLREKWDAVPTAVQAAVQLARRTGDRARDVSDRVRREVEQRLASAGATPEQLRVVREVVAADERDRAAFFGDSLPPGLRLVE